METFVSPTLYTHHNSHMSLHTSHTRTTLQTPHIRVRTTLHTLHTLSAFEMFTHFTFRPFLAQTVYIQASKHRHNIRTLNSCNCLPSILYIAPHAYYHTASSSLTPNIHKDVHPFKYCIYAVRTVHSFYRTTYKDVDEHCVQTVQESR
jgi:hypothetical protein